MLAIALTVLACQLATFAVDVLGGSSPPEAVRWSVGLPLPAFAWAQVEPGTVIPLDEGTRFNWSAPLDIPWLGVDALCTGTSWSQGLHVDVPGFAIDGMVACLWYLLLRWILQIDARHAVRAVVIGVVSGAALEFLSPTVLTFQGRVGWLSIAACLLLVPAAISILARDAIRGLRTRLIMSVIVAWISFALVRFSDPLLKGRIWSEPWNKREDLVFVAVISLVWWSITPAWTWWLRRIGAKLEDRALKRAEWS